MSRANPLRKALRWLPGLLVSLIAVYVISKFISGKDLIAAFRAFTWSDILIIVVLNLLSFVARALGWKNLLEGVSFKQAFLIVNEGYLFNNLIPRSGEIVRSLLVSSLTRISAFQAASSVLVERALDVVIAAAMFLLTLPFVVEMDALKPVAWALLICFLAAILFMVVLALHADTVKQKLAEWKIRSTFLKERVFPKFGSVLDGLATLKDPLKFSKSIFWILCSWVCWTTLLFFGITRITGAIPLLWGIFTQGLLALGIALPSAPASLGVYEGTMVAALAIFKVDQSAALSIALVLHFIQIFVTSILGIYGLSVQGQSISSLLERIRIRRNSTSHESTGEQ